MRSLPSVILGLTVALMIAPMAEAQTRTLRNTQTPAEIPPSSFSGAQYVDSRGCVFIRAGVGGTTRWVPRVNRDRSVVCGRSPSLRAAAPAAAPAERPAVATPSPTPAPAPRATAQARPAPVQTAEPVIRRTPAPAAPREIAAPVPRRVAPPTTAPAPRQNAAAPARPRAAAPRPMPQRVVQAPRPTALPVPPGCGASDLSARYLRNTPACAAALARLQGATPGAVVPSRTTATAPVPVRAAPSAAAVRANPVAPSPRRNAAAPVPVRATPPADALRVNPAAPSPNRSRSRPAIARPGCTGASELSTRYLRGQTGCGANANWSAGGQRRSAVEDPAPVITTASTRNERARGLFRTRSARTVIVPAAPTTFEVRHPPAGYERVLTDGRLNPNRGPQTLQGDYQMRAIWTDTVPRRLKRVVYVTR